MRRRDKFADCQRSDCGRGRREKGTSRGGRSRGRGRDWSGSRGKRWGDRCSSRDDLARPWSPGRIRAFLLRRRGAAAGDGVAVEGSGKIVRLRSEGLAGDVAAADGAVAAEVNRKGSRFRCGNWKGCEIRAGSGGESDRRRPRSEGESTDGSDGQLKQQENDVLEQLQKRNDAAVAVVERRISPRRSSSCSISTSSCSVVWEGASEVASNDDVADAGFGGGCDDDDAPGCTGLGGGSVPF